MTNNYKEKDGGTKPEFFNDYFNKNGADAKYTSGMGIVNELKSGNPEVMMGPRF